MKISPVSARTPFMIYTAQGEKTSPLPGKSDVVTLSDEGKKVQAQAFAKTSSLASSLDDFMDGAGKDGVITLDEIRAYGEKYAEEAENILGETLEKLGISADADIIVSTDETGEVKVSSGLSAEDQNRLAAALNNHPDFQQTYTKASSGKSLLDAADRHLEFAKAYARNPQAAVMRYGIGYSSTGEYVLQYSRGSASLVLQNRLSLMG